MTLIWILCFSLLGSVLSVVCAALFLVFPTRIRQRFLPGLVSYAAGTLLGAAFLGMIPHAMESVRDPIHISFAILSGIVVFFVLEKLVIWRHCHKMGCEVHNASGPLVIFGDALHNLVDGVVIAGGFLTSFEAGIAVSIAVIAHEIPQEVGDFAILIEYGYSRLKALLFNFLSSASTIVGAVVSYFALSSMHAILPYVLAVSAASFIYISLADILPGLQKRLKPVESAFQVALFLAGIVTIALMQHEHH